MRDFRKQTGWYMSGYPVGSEARGRFSHIASLAELEDVLAEGEGQVVGDGLGAGGPGGRHQEDGSDDLGRCVPHPLMPR